MAAVRPRQPASGMWLVKQRDASNNPARGEQCVNPQWARGPMHPCNSMGHGPEQGVGEGANIHHINNNIQQQQQKQQPKTTTNKTRKKDERGQHHRPEQNMHLQSFKVRPNICLQIFLVFVAGPRCRPKSGVAFSTSKPLSSSRVVLHSNKGHQVKGALSCPCSQCSTQMDSVARVYGVVVIGDAWGIFIGGVGAELIFKWTVLEETSGGRMRHTISGVCLFLLHSVCMYVMTKKLEAEGLWQEHGSWSWLVLGERTKGHRRGRTRRPMRHSRVCVCICTSTCTV